MRFLSSFVAPFLLLAAGAAQAASSWGFDNAKLTVSPKKAAASTKEKVVREFSDKLPILETPVAFSSSDSLKIFLTAKEDGKGKRPHQAFLILREPTLGLEAPFPLIVKDNGMATVEIKHSDLPVQLAIAAGPLRAFLVLASFGSSEGLYKPIFDLEVKLDQAATPIVYQKPLRYGKLAEIHHIFKEGDDSPPMVISIVFMLTILGAYPGLVFAWINFGANLSHLSEAARVAGIAHITFFGSVVAMEVFFYLYYQSWNLFQVLPFIGLLGILIFLSGTNALGEVQRRRLAGER
ncbi:hypothetical protein AAE478_009374 [Parahypoxylon ruwenzoriense]